MTAKQAQAFWELCRQGFPLDADEAARQWEEDQPYRPNMQIRIPPNIKRLIENCNWEVCVQVD